MLNDVWSTAARGICAVVVLTWFMARSEFGQEVFGSMRMPDATQVDRGGDQVQPAEPEPAQPAPDNANSGEPEQQDEDRVREQPR